MARFKVIYFLLLTYSCAEDNQLEDRIIKAPDKQILRQSTPYHKEQPSFMSRLASWIYPFGGSDSEPAETHHGGPPYLPPPKYQEPGCNPCDQAPWIPVASPPAHHKTVINFIPPSSQSVPPQYGAPPQFRPKPGFIEYLRPPLAPSSQLQPIRQDYGASIGMLPPPLKGGTYHSIRVTSYPPPGPSDSYGAPVVGPNAQFEVVPQFLPPLEPVQSFNQHSYKAIPFPNLSSVPVAPIHNYQNFKQYDNIPEHNSEVQVVPSVQVADYVASIEHPINIVQSPLVEVSVKNSEPDVGDDVKNGAFYPGSGRLNDNPIVVEDTHTAASAHNATHQKQSNGTKFYDGTTFIQPQKDVVFTPPSIDYTKWEPTPHLVTSMVPPKLVPSTWLYPVRSTSTTKKPKQIQIIIPYVNNKKPLGFEKNQPRKVPPKSYYTTLLPVYSPPPVPSSSTEETIWAQIMDELKLAESKKVTATAFTPPTTQVYNIKDLLRGTKEFYPQGQLPYDVISLQNNIDDWTQQAYNGKSLNFQNTKDNFVPSKKIPDSYFSTQPYQPETTTFEYEAAGSDQKESKLGEIENNLIFRESTTEEPTTTLKPSPVPFSPKGKKSLWDIATVTVSPLTKEKVYIVTPQPYDAKATTPMTAWSHPPQIQSNDTKAKFLIRVEPEDSNSRERLKEHDNPSPLTVVFSEWPHLINNLQTTTKPPTSRHPLLGLMGLVSYAPPANSTVQTITGHSKVFTVATITPATVAKV